MSGVKQALSQARIQAARHMEASELADPNWSEPAITEPHERTWGTGLIHLGRLGARQALGTTVNNLDGPRCESDGDCGTVNDKRPTSAGSR